MALITIWNRDGESQRIDGRELTFWLQSGWTTSPPEPRSFLSVEDEPFPGLESLLTPTLSLPGQSPAQQAEIFRRRAGTQPEPTPTVPGSTGGSFGDTPLSGAQIARLSEIFGTQGAEPPPADDPCIALAGGDPVLAALLHAQGACDTGGGGGRGGRRGRVGPTYVAPDRRLVEDFVRNSAIALQNTVSDAEIKAWVDLYLKEDRKNFDNPAKEIDPRQSVYQAIRQTEQYKAIHQLRPDSLDEFQWVQDRRSALVRAGVAPDLIEELTTQQSVIGSTTQEAARAGEVRQFSQSRRTLPGFVQSFRESARAAVNLL